MINNTIIPPWHSCDNKDRLFFYGGSFNPPHIAHILAVFYLRSIYPTSPIWVAPTLRHAFDKTLLPYDLRFKLLTMAMKNIPNITISNIEYELNLPKSRTIDCVDAILTKYPSKRPTIVIGADILEELPNWKNFDILCQKADFFVFPRPGYNYISPFGIPTLANVSSTQIRNALANHDPESCRGIVPPDILEILQELQN